VNPFRIEQDRLPPSPVSSFHRVIAAFDDIARAGAAPPWLQLRSREDALMDAKIVDERARVSGPLPLAGALVAAPDTPLHARRLAEAGAVVLAAVEPAALGALVLPRAVDAVVTTALPASCRDVVTMVPTRGLVPAPAGPAIGRPTVVARDIDLAQRTAAALTGPHRADPGSRGWPESVRLGAGDHPRIAVPTDLDLTALAAEARVHFAATVDSLRAAGASLTRAGLAAAVAPGGPGPTGPPDGHDALLLPVTGTRPPFEELVAARDVAAVALPDGGPTGIGVLTRAFDDQVAIDVAALLTGSQSAMPYPTIGVDLIAFGAYLRGQPRQNDLARLGARCLGFAETAPHYRMVALPGSPPQAGVIRSGRGACLVAERWLISPAGLRAFLADLPAPMTLGSVDLVDGSRATGILCDPAAAARGTDVTGFGCWRAYLRHLSTRRPASPPPPVRG
jgi:hypothetical protein